MKIVNYVKSLMLIALAMTVATMSAANVDSRTAQARAVQFLNSQSGTRMMASPATLKLTHAERSRVNAKANDYYVFNYDGGGYVTISDVTTLIDYLLGGSDAVCPICGNVNGDASVSIGDVTNLIDILLSGSR